MHLIGPIRIYVSIKRDFVSKKYFLKLTLITFFLIIASTLGVFDGNVYERLFEFARNSKLNQKEDNYGWYKNYTNSLKSKL